MRPPPRLAELVLVLVLVAGGSWLRWIHLGTPSLWWDEIVHARIAAQPSVVQVWRTARDGAAPGTGNAGAVPLDYLALHAWLAATPAPAPDDVERHHRVPAFAFAVAALPLVWLVGRALGGPATGLVALGLLATSLPHVLYAAEVRFYSLYVFATVANLAAFTALVRAPTTARFATFTLVAVALVWSGLYGVFVVGAEYLVLAALAWRHGRSARAVGIMAASAVVVGGALAVWVAPSAIGASYGRGAPASLDVASAVESTLLFFSTYTPWLAAVFGAALVAAPLVLRRDRVACAVTATFVLSAASIPAMVSIAHAKQYYFHPRHALFLLPMIHLATACLLGAAIARVVRRPFAVALVSVVVGVAPAVPMVAAYVRDPLPYFQATKTLRDVRGLARLIAARTAGAPADARWELLLSKGRPGHLANPTLAFYLDVYGLGDRVLLGGLVDPRAAVAELPTACRDGCRGPSSVPTLAALGTTDPFDQASLMRELMQLRPQPWKTEWSGLSIIVWTPSPPLKPPPGVTETHLDGMTIYDVR